jgi:YD repeat-containing protein
MRITVTRCVRRGPRTMAWLLLCALLAAAVPAAPAQAARSPLPGDRRGPPPVQPPAPAPQSVTVPPLVDPHLPSLVLHTVVTPDPLAVGATATLSVTVINQAPDPADDLVVTLPPPVGATPLPGPGLIDAAMGWQWSLGRLAGLSDLTVTATLQLAARPPGGALLVRPAATARGLAAPIRGVGGALASDQPLDTTTAAFTPGVAARLRSTDGAVQVDVPSDLAGQPLTLRYRTLAAALPDLQARGLPLPTPLAGRTRGLSPVILDARTALGGDVHQFSRALTITVAYTPEQLQAHGIAEDDLRLFWYDPAQRDWVALPTRLDTTARTASTVVDHFSAFTLGDGSSPSDAYLPSLQGWQVSLFTGAASFSYPIEVPPGPAGLKPNLVLRYSSAATDGDVGRRPTQQAGLIGKGWDLDLGAIGVRTTVTNATTGNAVRSYLVTLNGQGYDLTRGEALAGNTGPSDPDPTHWAWKPTDETFSKIRVIPNGTSSDHAGSVAVGTVQDPATSSAGRGGMVNGVWQPRSIWQIWAKDGSYSSPMARLSRLTVGASGCSGGGCLFDRSYGYDAVANVTSISDNKSAGNNQAFSYDHRDRLTSWTLNGASQSYVYDTIGNLTSKAGTGISYGANGNGTGAGPHQARTAGGLPYTYDQNGNLTARNGLTYTWDGANRPLSLAGNGVTESYRYDADGERIARTVGGQTTIYTQGLWDDTIGVSAKRLYRFNGQIVASRDGGTNAVTYLHGDHLGSVSLTTTSSGALLSQQALAPWGTVRRGGVPQTTLHDTGQRLDGTGLL